MPAGRAVGKSRLDAAAALWFAATRGSNARVICTGPTNQVVQNVFWEEVRRLFASAKIPGDCAVRCSTGCRLADGAQILGIVAEKPEGFQGIRAPEMLVIVDEASGVSDSMFQVIEGNMAGGSKFLLTGNPTRTDGYFRESFKPEHSDRFEVIKLPSTESPNVIEGREVVKGLATTAWLEARKREWGEDSPLYKIHVLGEVAEGQEGRLFSAEMIAGAEARWSSTPATGRLVIGLDPAGSTGEGDESAFAVRRGQKIVKLHARRGLTEQGHLTELLGLISIYRGDSADVPLVIVDRDGYVGARVYAEISAYQMQHEEAFQIIGVRGGERARRKPLTFDRVRDEVWFGLVDVLREGLAIPEDVKLARELAEVKAETNSAQRSKVTAKDELRAALGRSPDRADALCLACLEIAPYRIAEAETRPVHHDPYREPQARGIDPYAALDAWHQS